MKLKIGDIVEIHNTTLSGEAVFEGEATLREFQRDSGWYELWDVEFFKEAPGKGRTLSGELQLRWIPKL